MPELERLSCEIAVVVARLPGDLGPDPGRQIDGLALVVELDLGNLETGVLPFERVDLPGQPAPRHDVANLLDQGALPEQHQLLRVRHGNRIFELRPPQPRLARLDREGRCAPVHDAHAHRDPAFDGEVGLAQAYAPRSPADANQRCTQDTCARSLSPSGKGVRKRASELGTVYGIGAHNASRSSVLELRNRGRAHPSSTRILDSRARRPRCIFARTSESRRCRA